MPKVTNAKTSVKATVKLAAVALISQEFLETYAELYGEYDKANEIIKKVDKMCDYLLTVSTGLKDGEWKKLSPQDLQMLIAERLAHKQFVVEQGEFDFEINNTRNQQRPPWADLFIKHLGAEKAAEETQKTPITYSYDVVPTQVAEQAA